MAPGIHASEMKINQGEDDFWDEMYFNICAFLDDALESAI